MDKKLTDLEIIKALECCSTGVCKAECFGYFMTGTYECTTKLTKNAHDLINRQKAEIEQLEKDKENLAISFANAVARNLTVKAEAYKECIDMVKKKGVKVGVDEICIFESTLNNLLKELVGDTDES